MKKKEFTIVFIDDSIPDNDPIKLKVEQEYVEYKLFKLQKDGVKYIKENYKNKQIIVLLDYLFGSKSNPTGKWVLGEIRKFSLQIPVILLSSVANQISDYKDLINLGIFKISDKGDYENLIKNIEQAELIYPNQNDILAQMQAMLLEKKVVEQLLPSNLKNRHISFIKNEENINELKHFSEISIHNYKKFNNLTIKNINQINLIAGVNNSGKTTLLEAIQLISKQNDFDAFVELQRIRRKYTSIFNISNIFLSLPNTINLSGICNNKQVKLEISNFRKDNETNNYIFSLRFNSFVENDFIINTSNKDGKEEITKNNCEILETEVHLFGDKYSDRETQINNTTYRNICKSEFYSPYSFSNKEKLPKSYGDTIDNINRPKLKIVQFFKNIDPNIIDIDIDPRDKEDIRIKIIHSQFEKPCDLTDFGDGLQRIIAIALQFASVENGILLIDELENAIDFKQIENFAGLIIEFALMFNVQVFITSHSKECINAFFEYDAIEKMSCYTLTNNEVRYFSGYDYDGLFQSLNADLRKMGGK